MAREEKTMPEDEPEITEEDTLAEAPAEPEVIAHSDEQEHAPCVFNNGPSL